MLEALQMQAPISVRINTQKTVSKPGLATAVPWCENGYYLPERPLFAADPAFHAGHYYVQEAGSMVVGSIVKNLLSALPEPAVVLDLCAAPGGKSTHLASVLREGDMLVANEVIGTRTPILAENLCKWGAGNHIVSRADASRFGASGAQFDIVVADLPCSGEGMFRKDPAAIDEWSENNVKLCAERQQRIVTDIWPAIAPGGYLIYSTCTYNTAENEDNVNRLAETLGADILQPKFLGKEAFYCLQDGMFRAFPNKTQARFFCGRNAKNWGGHNLQSNLKKPHQGHTCFTSWIAQKHASGGNPTGSLGHAHPEPGFMAANIGYPARHLCGRNSHGTDFSWKMETGYSGGTVAGF